MTDDQRSAKGLAVAYHGFMAAMGGLPEIAAQWARALKKAQRKTGVHLVAWDVLDRHERAGGRAFVERQYGIVPATQEQRP